MTRSLNPTRRRPQFDAATALLALRALGCAYRPDVAVIDGAWLATCPGCRRPGTLRIRELRERDDDHRDPPVSVGCQRRCAEPAELATILSTDPDMLEARAEAARWRAHSTWLTDFTRRAFAADEFNEAPALAVAA
jgi:hypothetical protein